MYNWKLNALFIIGLTLITGVFSNAAMAATNDGKGTVTAAWAVQDLTGITIPNTGFGTSPLNAGSTHNILQFTYRAWEDHNNNENSDDGEGVNMAGGQFRITFPIGWKVSKKLIQVKDGESVVYETDGMGDLKRHHL